MLNLIIHLNVILIHNVTTGQEDDVRMCLLLRDELMTYLRRRPIRWLWWSSLANMYNDIYRKSPPTFFVLRIAKEQYRPTLCMCIVFVCAICLFSAILRKLPSKYLVNSFRIQNHFNPFLPEKITMIVVWMMKVNTRMKWIENIWILLFIYFRRGALLMLNGHIHNSVYHIKIPLAFSDDGGFWGWYFSQSHLSINLV